MADQLFGGAGADSFKGEWVSAFPWGGTSNLDRPADYNARDGDTVDGWLILTPGSGGSVIGFGF